MWEGIGSIAGAPHTLCLGDEALYANVHKIKVRSEFCGRYYRPNVRRLPPLAAYPCAGAATGKSAPLRTCFARSSSTAVIPSDAFCVSISIV